MSTKSTQAAQDDAIAHCIRGALNAIAFIQGHKTTNSFVLSRKMDSCFEKAFCEMAADKNESARHAAADGARTATPGAAVEVTVE